MKLESFLQESLDSIDISKFTDGVEPKSLATIKIILSKLKAYSKVSLEDVREDEMFLHVTNGLVSFDMSFSKDQNIDGETIAIAEIAVLVNHNYVHNADNIPEHSGHLYALLNTLSREFDLRRQERVVAFLDNALKVASAFEDWYFEISGSVGKIKLIKITTDLEDGSSNSVWKWTPYAGQFWVDGDHIEVRS